MQSNIDIGLEFIKKGAVHKALRIDQHWRFASMDGRRHGLHPQQHVDRALANFGINFVLRGSGVYTTAGGRTYPLSAGALFHRWPDVVHSTWFDPASDYIELYLCLDRATAVDLMNLKLIAAQPVLHPGINAAVMSAFSDFRRLMESTETQIPSPAALGQIIHLLGTLYALARESASLDEWSGVVRQACLRLEQTMDDRVPVEEIAAELGVAYPSFRKQFKRVTGMAPAEFRVRRRLDRACTLLLRQSVKEVSVELGYCDMFTFSAQFKRQFGISPRGYQRDAQ